MPGTHAGFNISTAMARWLNGSMAHHASQNSPLKTRLRPKSADTWKPEGMFPLSQYETPFRSLSQNSVSGVQLPEGENPNGGFVTPSQYLVPISGRSMVPSRRAPRASKPPAPGDELR